MAKTTVHPEARTPSRAAPRDDLVPPRREPAGGEVVAAVVAALAVVAAVLFVPDAVTDDVDLAGDGALLPIAGDLAWAADVPASATTPLVDGDTVLVGQGVSQGPLDVVPDADGPAEEAAPAAPATVRAHHASTGAERWSATLDGSTAVPLLLGPDAALVRTTAVVAMLDADTGEVVWDRRYDPERPDPVAAADVLLVPGDDLTALEIETGEPRWQRRFPVSLAPTVVATEEGDVAVTVAPGAVRAVDPRDGDERWAVGLDRSAGFAVPAAVADGLVVVANRLGDVEAFRLRDGERAWAVQARPDDPAVSLFVAGDLVVVGGESGTVSTFDLDTGEAAWQLDTSVDLSAAGAMQAAGRTVVVGGPPSGELVVVDRRTGEPRWTLESGTVSAPPLVVGPELIAAIRPAIGPRLDDLVALTIDRGREFWRSPLGAQVFTRPVPSEAGIAVVGTRSLTGEADRLRAFG